MKILSVIVAHPLRKVSGATNAGLELSAATAGLVDLEVAIMWDSAGVEQAGNLTKRYFECTNRLGSLERFAPRFIKVPLYDSDIPAMIRRGAFDIVHLHNLIPTFAAERIANACRRHGVPYVISTHGFIELSRYAEINGFGPVKSLLIDFVLTRPFRRIVAGAERLFALSDCEFGLLHDMGVKQSKIDVVTNGVNEFYLDAPTPLETEDVRKRFVSREGVPVLLFMGSLHAYKGVGTFLASLKGIKGPFQAIVAGRFKDPNEPQMLMDKAQVPASIRQHIHFTGGVTNEELRALYHLAHLFVYPTAGDTLPLVVLEAMACGCPVLSTTVGGIPFAVPAECGILVRPNDSAAVVEAANSLLAAPDRRQAMGIAGRKRIKSVFRWHLSAQCAVEGYERVVGCVAAIA